MLLRNRGVWTLLIVIVASTIVWHAILETCESCLFCLLLFSNFGFRSIYKPNIIVVIRFLKTLSLPGKLPPELVKLKYLQRMWVLPRITNRLLVWGFSLHFARPRWFYFYMIRRFGCFFLICYLNIVFLSLNKIISLGIFNVKETRIYKSGLRSLIFSVNKILRGYYWMLYFKWTAVTNF